MIFLYFFSFLFLINLYNSFNFINNKLNNRILMRCDYYIEKKLYIYYNDNSINYINLKRDKGYYDEIYDDINLFNISNDDSSNSIWKKLKEYHLQHRIVLYLI